MATFKRFEEIEAWRKATGLVNEIYMHSNEARFSHDFGLRDQIRRAGVSIMANIAEGYERSGTGEFLQFLAIAKGSAAEVRSHLYVALDQGYLDRKTFDNLCAEAQSTARMISKLMEYLRGSAIKGVKYKS
jgi:four helix bundle protein